jgi:intracellular sulfur oxidation DsrE/DsrF family protein
MTQVKRGRRSLMTGLGAAAAGVAVAGTRTGAQTPASPSTFVAQRHDKDAWLDTLPGKHRTILDVTTAAGVAEAIGFANNIFTGNSNGYGLKDGDVAMVMCLRHMATVFAFTDPLWAKYGKQMASMVKYESRTGEPPAANPHNSPPRASFDALAKRGVHFVVCDLASHRFARGLAGSGDGEAVYKEMAANMIPNARFVAAGVVGVTRAQEHGYGLIFVG